MAFKAAWWLGLIWFAFLVTETLAEPETVEGLMKKNQNSWNVPVMAHQPNENKPTKVIGGYPGFKPDTLARPLKPQKGRVPFGQYLHGVSSVIPDPILKWLSQRQSISTPKPTQEENTIIPPTASTQPPKEPRVVMTSIPSLIEKPLSKPKLEETTNTPEEKRVEIMDKEMKTADVESTKVESSTEIEKDIVVNPKVAAVIIDDYIARREDKISVAGLVIGLTFVAAFLSIVIGLVGHGMIKKCRKLESSGRSSRNSWMRSPGDEDRTPPELRPGSNSGHPAYSDSRRNSNRTRHLPGTLPGHTGTPFFNGKLILHDPPGLGNGTRGVVRPFNPGNVLASTSNTGFLMTSPPSKFGAIPKKMPSPAAQVTDILVSPKYDDDETTEEEEDSDDTVYECPGLAAANGEAIEVRNPFFMEGDDLEPASGVGLANKKPISQYTDLFHHQEIAGFN